MTIHLLSKRADRLGTSCSFSCSTRTMSPGSTPGAWSASPENVIFCPCLMPLSTWTSRSLVSLLTLWPSHFLQRSFSLITSPGTKTMLVVIVIVQRHVQVLVVFLWHITLSVAICTDRLHLLDHPRGQLSNHDSHSSSSACHTLLHCPRLTSLTRRQTVRHQHC